MVARSPLRFLAPISLVAVLIAVVIVLASAGGGSDGNANRADTMTTTAPVPTRRTYVVRTGDSLLGISNRTGVPIARLRALNSGIDPQTLRPGQRIKLRP